ncbi:hypothetical protein ABT126_40950 [Streptomyces sp. NPDC002012]|uniref:hypothetical protein n=1 Tax=Streptomyces sp. NPDC002012 TaxID=3154532 RepID=UPI003317160E
MAGCGICGAPANSREHVIPQWISSSTLKAVPSIDQTSVVLGTDGAPPRAVSQNFGDITVKCVCTTCNNGWINDLEETSGRSCVLSSLAPTSSWSSWTNSSRPTSPPG